MSYPFYKVLHLVSLFALFSGLGVALYKKQTDKLIKIVTIVAGLLALVSGFGLLARLQIHGQWPLWVYGKLCIWILLTVTGPILAKRFPLKNFLYFIFLLLGGVAAYLAIYKPLLATP